MKKLIFVIPAVLFLFSCKNETPTTETNVESVEKTEISKKENLDFLLGNWKRTNDKPKHETFEFWQKTKPDFYEGIGFTLHNSDTIFKEILCLRMINDTFNLEVSGVNENPVLFKFSAQSESSFIAENPKHDFPQKIEYRMQGDSLKAFVSGQGHLIDFGFIKIEN